MWPQPGVPQSRPAPLAVRAKSCYIAQARLKLLANPLPQLPDHSHELLCLAFTAMLRARWVGWLPCQNKQCLEGLAHSMTGACMRASWQVAGPGRKSHE